MRKGSTKGETTLDLARLASAIELVCLSRGAKRRGDELVIQCPSPSHEDVNPSASYSCSKMVWHCHACGEGGGYTDLAPLLNIDLRDYNGSTSRSHKREVVRESNWSTPDFDKSVTFIKTRKDYSDGGKGYWWDTLPAGETSRSYSLGERKATSLPLFGWDRLKEREPGDDSPVLIVEGEKACEALLAKGIDAVGTVVGAPSIPCDKALEVLHDRHDIAWPDNDDPGNKQMEGIGQALMGKAASVSIWKPTDLTGKGDDACEWLALRDGKSDEEIVAELYSLIENEAVPPPVAPVDVAEKTPLEQVREWVASNTGNRGPEDLEAIIPLLRKLKVDSPLGYDVARNEVIGTVPGVRVTTLDDLVKNPSADEGSSELGLTSPEPWGNAVDGGELLDDLARTFCRFLALPKGAPTTMALWTVFAHAIDAFNISPYLGVCSPEKRCGKTTVLDVVGALVPKSLQAASLTAPGAFRIVEKYSATLMIDECDTFLSGNDELRGVLNAGHRRGQYCIRCVGEDNDPVAFDPFGAKCLAMIGRFPDTLADRSLLIHIRRRSPEESLERVRLDRLDADMEPLSRKCARWVEDHFDELKAADPEVPNELNDRARDNWRVLLSIADAVGGAWPAKAREAATLTSDQDGDERSAKSMLLEDFRRLFDERNVDQLASADVVEALVLMEERPWPEWYRGNPITARGVAKLLRDYKIKPRQLWIDGNKTRGYSRDAFEDTWRHYLDSGGSTGRTVANTEPEPNSVPVEEDEPTDPENAEDPRQQGILPDIPDGNPSTGRGA